MDLTEEEVSSDIQSKTSGEISVVDGRLYFPSKENLGEIFQEFADASEEDVYGFMREFYNHDFFSLRPPVFEGNEDDMIEQYRKRTVAFLNRPGVKMEEEIVFQKIDDTEFIIGSDTFAALLNENAEIHVDRKIYKYTDAGLFIVDVDSYYILDDFLSEKQISDNLIIETPQSAISVFSKEVIGRGYSEFQSGQIGFFISPCGPLDPSTTDPYTSDPGSPIDEPCDNWYGGGGTTNPNPVEPLDGLEDFVNGLPICSSSIGFLGWIFGTNKICIDKYESRMRVRTKVFNHNYLLVFHIGIKVKHQSRKAGVVWSRKKTDVVAAGIEMVQFEYDYSSVITSGFQSVNSNSVKYSVKPKSFTYNVETNIWNDPNGNQQYTLLNTSLWTPNLPPVFHDDLIIEAFNTGFTISSETINQHFWKSVWNSAKNQIKSLANDPNWENPLNTTLLVNYPNMKRLVIQRSYFSHCTNCSKRNKTLDFDGAITLGIGYNTSSGNFTYSGGTGNLVSPKNFKIKMYGAAKRNGNWHGSKLYHGVD